MIKNILICFSLLMASTLASAEPATPLTAASFTSNLERLDLSPHLEILVDDTASMTLDEVMQPARDSDYRSVAEIGNSFGFTTAAYWVRFSLDVDPAQFESLLLQLDQPMIDHVAFYTVSEDGVATASITGDGTNFDTREYRHRTFLFSLPPQQGQTRDYYLRLETEGSMQIPLQIWTASAFAEHASFTEFVFGGYYGFMFLLMMAALASYLIIRDRLFLYYAAYLFCYVMFQFSFNGFAFQHLWPDAPWWSSKAVSTFIGLGVITALLFSGHYLQVWGRKHPVVKMVFIGLGLFGAAGVILSALDFYTIAVKMSTLAGLLIPPVVAFAGIVSLMSGYRPARYLLFAWSFFLLGAFIAGLLHFGLVPHSFLTVYAIQIGSTLEILLLGYAVMARIEMLRHERARAIRSLVDQRTNELELTSVHLRTLIAMMPDLVWLKDADGNYAACNSKVEDLFHKECHEIIGKTDFTLLEDEQATRARANDLLAISTGKPSINEEVFKDKDGNEIILDTVRTAMHMPDGTLIGVLGIGRDITERLKTEEALRRSQKMDAVGQLSSGVAHDFNNILGIILGNLELLQKTINGNKAARNHVDQIKLSAQRATDLTRQLLSFSRSEAGSAKPVNINEALQNIASLIARSITAEIEVEHDFESDPWLAEVDPVDFEDAVINLILNARDAMPEGGRLVLKTANATLDQAYCSNHLGVQPGEYVMLEVSDSGFGIPAEIRERIFEPFFTTKPSGEGSGLGLAMVFGFIRRSGSHIRVGSSPDGGTTFRIYLPKFQQEVIEQSDEASADHYMPRGSEVILVVDDEEALLDVASTILEELGYQVLQAKDGNEALQLLNSDQRIDLLFSDIVMPGGVSGLDLKEQAMTIRPGMPVLLTSGNTGIAVDNPADIEARDRILPKPYDFAELAMRIRELLETDNLTNGNNLLRE